MGVGFVKCEAISLLFVVLLLANDLSKAALSKQTMESHPSPVNLDLLQCLSSLYDRHEVF